MSFQVRQMSRDELALVLQWAVAEGWNPGVNDAEAFFDTDPQGFFIGEVNGEPVGSVSAVTYDEHFGFVGLFMVRPEFRGEGYGDEIWETGMLHLGSRNIGLACRVEQENYYGECRFQLAYRSVRREGIGGGTRPQQVVELGSVPMEELTAYDARLFPAPRPQFLESWIRQPGTTALGIVRDGRLSGYGVLRPCHTGHKIGPLFADDRQTADSLFQGLAAAVPSESIFLDTPEPNVAAVELARQHHMSPVAQTAWMYTKGPPAVDMQRVFGMTSRGLG